MMKISFIIPAYNASKTIVDCLDSIYNNVMLNDDDFEIIVIDDCSTDNTIKIVQKYILSHNNIRLICQPKNNRQGAARNRGLIDAKGEYVMLVDSDDIVLSGIINALNFALLNKIDILHCGVEIQRGNSSYGLVSLAPKNTVINGYDFCEEYHTIETCQAPWAYLYRNEFLKRVKIKFEEGRRLEDTDWVEKHLSMAEMIASVDDVIYLYKENPGSTMHTTRFDTCADWLHFSYRRLKFAETIKDRMPQYASRLIEAGKWGVIANTAFRRLTRFSPFYYLKIRQRCGNECMAYLGNIQWIGFTKIAINHPVMAFTSLFISCPLAKVGRFFIHAIRKY